MTYSIHAQNVDLNLMNNFTYKWKLTDLQNVPRNGLEVFSCFACGGGSTMGYKMSGFKVIGCNEIDPEMMEIYKANHNPDFPFMESIETFKKRNDLPRELFDLDILDGSPPCSSFSMSGSREKKWGKKKKFREGQSEQILDDLFFHYIDLAQKLRPKVIVAENVKGMLMGNAKGYVKQIIGLFKSTGYNVQLFCLNSASMGVPQRRERIFFICHRNDLNYPPLKLGFSEKPIPMRYIVNDPDINHDGEMLSEAFARWWRRTPPGKSFSSAHPKGSFFNTNKLHPDTPRPTITATGGAALAHWTDPRKLSNDELKLTGSYPLDYDFKNIDVKYAVGMSVPPLMTHKISQQIAQQWFKI